MSGNNEEIKIEGIDFQAASFQLLLEIASRMRMISSDISLIKIAVLRGLDDLKENLSFEGKNNNEDFKKKQYEILAEVMNKFPKDNQTNVSSIDTLLKPFLEDTFVKYNEFLTVAKEHFKKLDEEKTDQSKKDS